MDFENRIGEEPGREGLFDGSRRVGNLSSRVAGRSSTPPGAPPQQHNSRQREGTDRKGAMPDWKPCQAPAETDATPPGRRSTARVTSATSCRSTSTRSTKFIRADRDRYGQHARQPALRQRLRHEQHEPRRLCRSRLSSRQAAWLKTCSRRESNPAQGQPPTSRCPDASNSGTRASRGRGAGGTPFAVITQMGSKLIRPSARRGRASR